jgi:hypothetical protein
VSGWIFTIVGVWTALYPIGIAPQVAAQSLQGAEPLEISMAKVLVNSVISVAIGAGLFLLGRRLVKSSDAARRGPPRPDTSM